MTSEERKALKVGEEIGYCGGPAWSKTYHLSKISKITPSGQIVLEDGTRFSKDGREMGGSSMYGCWLVSAEAVRKKAMIQESEDRLFHAIRTAESLIISAKQEKTFSEEDQRKMLELILEMRSASDEKAALEKADSE